MYQSSPALRGPLIEFLAAEFPAGIGRLLDIGTGYGLATAAIRARVPVGLCVGLEAWWPCVAAPAHRAPYDVIGMGDIRASLPLVAWGTFDVVLALGVLEHLERTDALRVLGHARRIARQAVIAQVPIGPFPQGEVDGNPYTPHRSEWTRADWEAQGGRLVAEFAASGLFVWKGGDACGAAGLRP